VAGLGTKAQKPFGYWIGYKLHLDCADGDIPISALTSASMHDSQAAIPLAQMSEERVTSLYDLMDAAYDAPQIHEYSAKLGHVPIIDNNPRSSEIKYMDPTTKARFKDRWLKIVLCATENPARTKFTLCSRYFCN